MYVLPTSAICRIRNYLKIITDFDVQSRRRLCIRKWRMKKVSKRETCDVKVRVSRFLNLSMCVQPHLRNLKLKLGTVWFQMRDAYGQKRYEDSKFVQYARAFWIFHRADAFGIFLLMPCVSVSETRKSAILTRPPVSIYSSATGTSAILVRKLNYWVVWSRNRIL